MRIGTVFPQTEIGNDPGAIRAYAEAAEQLGYSHLLAFDHVIGANPASRPDWDGTFDYRASFHEPFVLFGFLAGFTQSIELITGIIILPQRQTVLVAKQAAEIDVLSGGRLRLGVAVGWNEVEFEALGEAFRGRGRRIEEQVDVMRRLWTEELITFEGEWHRIIDAGINPLPIQRPIPIWFGGDAEPVIRRAGQMGDGWLPEFDPDAAGREKLDRLRGYAREAGRDPDDIAIEHTFAIHGRSPEACAARMAAWRDIGATHISINTMGGGLAGADAHIDAIRRFKDTVEGV